jgi:hypothetical protein
MSLIGHLCQNRPKISHILQHSHEERRSAIVLELTFFLDEDAISNLCCQFPIPADYDGVGSKGTKFVFYL